MTEARHEGADSPPSSPGESEADSASSSRSPDAEPLSPALWKAGHENFPVATRLLPRRVRRHLLAVYAYARMVDDVGDVGSPEKVDVGERQRLLDLIEDDLPRMYSDSPEPPRVPALRGIAATADECDIPQEPFRRLIEANRQDQVVHRYETFSELLDYCVLSANPVGHMVLHVFGVATPERMALSDHVCSALQLVEHWQDVPEDYGMGRVYLPGEDLRRFGCATADLAAPAAAERVRELMAFQARRASRMLDDGAPLVRTLSGFARVAVAGYIAGGRATLAAMAAGGHDVLSVTPRPTPATTAREWLRLLAVRG